MQSQDYCLYSEQPRAKKVRPAETKESPALFGLYLCHGGNFPPFFIRYTYGPSYSLFGTQSWGQLPDICSSMSQRRSGQVAGSTLQVA